MSPIVVFVTPSDFSQCLALTNYVFPAPSLVSVDVVVIVPVVPVAMVSWPSFWYWLLKFLLVGVHY